jgi:hypothetical protein
MRTYSCAQALGRTNPRYSCMFGAPMRAWAEADKAAVAPAMQGRHGDLHSHLYVFGLLLRFSRARERPARRPTRGGLAKRAGWGQCGRPQRRCVAHCRTDPLWRCAPSPPQGAGESHMEFLGCMEG